ncbi:MAG: Inner membrane protein [Chlamydiae bacterium]|nr:Inner membrane protein [Chlamydiota bacterium]
MIAPFIDLLSQNASHAHWVFFSLLMLAGFNLPISEDLVVLSSAVVAATVTPQNTYKLFAFVFMGCYLSDWLSYWIGRVFTPWLRKRKLLGKMVDNRRIVRITRFYSKYGVSTLLIGRFIPFGVRNFLFMSAGMVRMNFFKFIIIDGIACLLSNTIWFTLAYSLAENYQIVLSYMKRANIIIFAIFALLVFGVIGYKFYRKKKGSNPTTL